VRCGADRRFGFVGARDRDLGRSLGLGRRHGMHRPRRARVRGGALDAAGDDGPAGRLRGLLGLGLGTAPLKRLGSAGDGQGRCRVVAMLVVAPAAEAATLTVSAPKGVPATVTVGKQVLAKAPASRSKRFKVGSGRVRAPQFSFNGVVYAPRVTRTRVVYRALPAAKELHATAVAQTQVTLDWKAPRNAVVALRRTVGCEAGEVRARGREGREGRQGAQAGLDVHVRALHEDSPWLDRAARGHGRHVASSDPAVAAYVAPPSTVILHAGDAFKATLNPKGVSVALPAGAAGAAGGRGLRAAGLPRAAGGLPRQGRLGVGRRPRRPARAGLVRGGVRLLRRQHRPRQGGDLEAPRPREPGRVPAGAASAASRCTRSSPRAATSTGRS